MCWLAELCAAGCMHRLPWCALSDGLARFCCVNHLYAAGHPLAGGPQAAVLCADDPLLPARGQLAGGLPLLQVGWLALPTACVCGVNWHLPLLQPIYHEAKCFVEVRCIPFPTLHCPAGRCTTPPPSRRRRPAGRTC